MRIEHEVLAVLSRAQTTGNALILVEQLDRRMYERTNKVLEAAGGIWNRKAKAHLFPIDASDRIDQIILTGEVAIPKDEFNFFPSPPSVVARLLEIADLRPGMRVLEPEAGRGDIAFACAAAGAIVDCYELMEENFRFLAADPRIASVSHADFLLQPPTPCYLRCVMNPPFFLQADIRHVTHALKFLETGGLLTSVMASSITYRDNKLTQDFRDLIRLRGGEIEALPEGSFKSSGTAVQTVIVSIPA